jgi:hypothetical protein
VNESPIASVPRATPAPAATYQPPPALQPTNVIAALEERSIWLAGEEARLCGERARVDANLAAVRAESKQLNRMLRVGRRDAARDAINNAEAPRLSLVGH